MRDKHLAAYLGVFLVLGLLIALRTPFGDFPDETSHFAFVKYLRAHHALPKLSLQGPMISVAFHPPLYYILAALVLDPAG
ncbi:MAG TPA: hypothetical protein VLR94_08660, partial [Acidobacteriota bacterium]|nr:hypothetical protein [Acidobacteriota bacterium]